MAWIKGKKRSPETIAKIRAANLGKKHSPEAIAKMRGRKRSPETIAKIRAAKLKNIGIPDGFEQMYTNLRTRLSSSEALVIIAEHRARAA